MKYMLLLFLVVFLLLSFIASRFSQNMFYYLDHLDNDNYDENYEDDEN